MSGLLLFKFRLEDCQDSFQKVWTDQKDTITFSNARELEIDHHCRLGTPQGSKTKVTMTNVGQLQEGRKDPWYGIEIYQACLGSSRIKS